MPVIFFGRGPLRVLRMKAAGCVALCPTSAVCSHRAITGTPPCTWARRSLTPEAAYEVIDG